MDNLVKSWGYDPVEQAAALRPVSPITSPGTWLSGNDYPLNAVMNGHSGLVQFRLDVDAEGKVLGCFILSRTSPDDFADTTCRAMIRRARLQPALDAQGKPIRSYFVGKVVWLASR
jgi:TonB family protein